MMISEEQLDQYRVDSTLLRVIRDVSPTNDVRGIVVAWDDETVLIRKKNRKVVKLARSYSINHMRTKDLPEFMLPQDTIEPDGVSDDE